MISGNVERLLEKSDIISSKVLEEFSGDNYFSYNLRPTFRHDSLSQFDKKVLNLRFSHLFSNFEENITIHVVSVYIFDRIM